MDFQLLFADDTVIVERLDDGRIRFFGYSRSTFLLLNNPDRLQVLLVAQPAIQGSQDFFTPPGFSLIPHGP
jgi:hypothetical protein